MAGKKSSANFYLWFDTEYTTLDLDRADLLQVALIVTDGKLRRIHRADEDLNLVVRHHGKVAPWVEENLGPLVQRCRSDEAVEIEHVDFRLAEQLDRIFGTASPEIRMRPVLAGNSVHADWYLARRFLPKFYDRMHYRIFDVTTIKLEWIRWFHGSTFDKEDPDQVRRYFPGAQLGSEIGPHDAYYDVQASIAELAYYRSRLAKQAKKNGEPAR